MRYLDKSLAIKCCSCKFKTYSCKKMNTKLKLYKLSTSRAILNGNENIPIMNLKFTFLIYFDNYAAC